MSKSYIRTLKLHELLKNRSGFLFGPRATGKTSLILQQLKNSTYIDLLNADIYEQLLKRPTTLEEMISEKSKLIVIDEIQKLPRLLDEVHRLIETKKYHFLLTGSSTRKLRRDGANMLGGRAREIQLFPLTYHEIDNFDLIKYLNFGGLPIIYKSDEPMLDLKSYVRIYLAEEIKAESLIRNYERFVRFLEVMATVNGQELNYANIASDSGVPVRTIENHIEVLKDTLMGFELLPFTKTLKRKAITKSKFYFFDIGVANYLSEKIPFPIGSADIGIAFEHFIINEVRAYLSYNQLDKKLGYWRSKKYEVDLTIGKDIAIEIKFANSIRDEHFKNLEVLSEENIFKSYFIVGRFKQSGQRNNIRYLNYEEFLQKLWSGQLIS